MGTNVWFICFVDQIALNTQYDFNDSNSVPEGQQTEILTDKMVDIVLFVI